MHIYTVCIALGFAKVETVKRLVFNSHSKADGLHQFMQIHFHHRQGKSARMMTVKQSRLIATVETHPVFLSPL